MFHCFDPLLRLLVWVSGTNRRVSFIPSNSFTGFIANGRTFVTTFVFNKKFTPCGTRFPRSVCRPTKVSGDGAIDINCNQSHMDFRMLVDTRPLALHIRP
jgi:hypothetical protein